MKDVTLPKDESKITVSDVAETSKLTNKASLDIINDIGSNPDKVVAGKFTGQGIENGASRGDVFFRIKGDDVVVTKPDGSFVTILKDGINNTSVKNALKGDPK